MSFFIAGTDTGVGKTRFTCLLLEALRGQRIDAVGYKPVCCGERDDAVALSQASGDLDLDRVNPLWMKAPVAPMVAGMLGNHVPDPAQLIEGYRKLAEEHRHVIVEGCGGWRVPLVEGYDMADLAIDLGLPIILVVGNRLGALNHTLLTVDSMRGRGANILGLVINQLQDELDTAAITNKGVISQLTGLPILAEVIYDQDFIDLDPFAPFIPELS